MQPVKRVKEYGRTDLDCWRMVEYERDVAADWAIVHGSGTVASGRATREVA